MFRQRFFTSLIMIPLILWALYYAPVMELAFIGAALAVVCAYEWLPLIPLTHWSKKIIFFLLVGLAILLSFKGGMYFLTSDLVLWLLLIVAIVTYPSSMSYWGHSFIVGFISLIVLAGAARSLAGIYLHPNGTNLLVYLFCLVWAADSGAYIAGKLYGRHKIIPFVSPGKTWEGLAGGITLAIFIAWAANAWFHPMLETLVWFLMAFITVLMSVFGDLFISMLKRRGGLKDTGFLIPGHGGLLDRLDSLLAAAPFFYVMLYYFQGV